MLPLAGETQLTIQRSKPGAARSMDLLEHTVRTIEDFMGEPFPVRYVGILFKDAVHAAEGSAGTNFGHVIAQRAKYDVDDGSWEARWLPSLTAHEIAHFYWGGDEDWIDEGAATFMEFIVENARTGASLTADQYPCAYYANLSELDRANPLHPSHGGDITAEFGCNYSLGERLFLDLYRTLGQEQFREGFRNLYLASKGRGSYAGIAEVEAAFKKDATPEIIAAVDTVINAWYNGPTPLSIAPPDTGPVQPGLQAFKARVVTSFVSLENDWDAFGNWRSFLARETETFSVAEGGDVDRAYIYLGFTLPVTSGTKSVSLDVVEYFEDGFAFYPRQIPMKFRPASTIGWWRIPVGPRIGDPWLPGRYGVYVYDGDRKVAQVEYEVAP
jgi:hypothetical protein